jgi:uncharacterized RDD family membrane protein YckC
MAIISLHRPTTGRRSSVYSSLECRFAAYLIDTSLFFFIQSLGLYFFIGYPSTNALETSFLWPRFDILFSDMDYIGKLFLTNFYFLVVHWLYYALMESSLKSGTIGKIVLGLEVKDLNGKRISFKKASIRYFSRYLSMGIFFGGFIVAAFNRRHQTLHDIIAGCTVRIKKL